MYLPELNSRKIEVAAPRLTFSFAIAYMATLNSLATKMSAWQKMAAKIPNLTLTLTYPQH